MTHELFQNDMSRRDHGNERGRGDSRGRVFDPDPLGLNRNRRESSSRERRESQRRQPTNGDTRSRATASTTDSGSASGGPAAGVLQHPHGDWREQYQQLQRSSGRVFRSQVVTDGPPLPPEVRGTEDGGFEFAEPGTFPEGHQERMAAQWTFNDFPMEVPETFLLAHGVQVGLALIRTYGLLIVAEYWMRYRGYFSKDLETYGVGTSVYQTRPHRWEITTIPPSREDGFHGGPFGAVYEGLLRDGTRFGPEADGAIRSFGRRTTSESGRIWAESLPEVRPGSNRVVVNDREISREDAAYEYDSHWANGNLAELVPCPPITGTGRLTRSDLRRQEAQRRAQQSREPETVGFVVAPQGGAIVGMINRDGSAPIPREFQIPLENVPENLRHMRYTGPDQAAPLNTLLQRYQYLNEIANLYTNQARQTMEEYNRQKRQVAAEISPGQNWKRPCSMEVPPPSGIVDLTAPGRDMRRREPEPEKMPAPEGVQLPKPDPRPPPPRPRPRPVLVRPETLNVEPRMPPPQPRQRMPPPQPAQQMPPPRFVPQRVSNQINQPEQQAMQQQRQLERETAELVQAAAEQVEQARAAQPQNNEREKAPQRVTYMGIRENDPPKEKEIRDQAPRRTFPPKEVIPKRRQPSPEARVHQEEPKKWTTPLARSGAYAKSAPTKGAPESIKRDQRGKKVPEHRQLTTRHPADQPNIPLFIETHNTRRRFAYERQARPLRTSSQINFVEEQLDEPAEFQDGHTEVAQPALEDVLPGGLAFREVFDGEGRYYMMRGVPANQWERSLRVANEHLLEMPVLGAPFYVMLGQVMRRLIEYMHIQYRVLTVRDITIMLEEISSRVARLLNQNYGTRPNIEEGFTLYMAMLRIVMYYLPQLASLEGVEESVRGLVMHNHVMRVRLQLLALDREQSDQNHPSYPEAVLDNSIWREERDALGLDIFPRALREPPVHTESMLHLLRRRLASLTTSMDYSPRAFVECCMIDMVPDDHQEPTEDDIEQRRKLICDASKMHDNAQAEPELAGLEPLLEKLRDFHDHNELLEVPIDIDKVDEATRERNTEDGSFITVDAIRGQEGSEPPEEPAAPQEPSPPEGVERENRVRFAPEHPDGLRIESESEQGSEGSRRQSRPGKKIRRGNSSSRSRERESQGSEEMVDDSEEMNREVEQMEIDPVVAPMDEDQPEQEGVAPPDQGRRRTPKRAPPKRD